MLVSTRRVLHLLPLAATACAFGVARPVVTMAKPVAVVIGVGPGVGNSCALKFASEGYAVGLVSRSTGSLTPTEAAISSSGGSCLAVPADCSSEQSVREAMAKIKAELGSPEVLIYNTGPPYGGPSLADLPVDQFKNALDVGCVGALVASQEVLPGMVAAGKGTIIFTGATAALRGGSKFAMIACAKFALRALAQSMAREFQPKGVHVGHVIIDGMVLGDKTKQFRPDDPDEAFLSPDAIADQYWALHKQDKTTWTHELDLRPHVEKW